MSIIKGTGRCANCGVKERETQSYCRSCSNQLRNKNKRPKNPCSNCQINPKIPGMGQRYCKECREFIPGQILTYEKTREYTRRWKYKLEPLDIETILIQQNFMCAIPMCKTPIDISSMHVDHDHMCCNNKNKQTCGKCVRGFLCNSCNTGLGRFRDDPDFLKEAFNYIIFHREKMNLDE